MSLLWRSDVRLH